MTSQAFFLDTSYIYALFNTRDQWRPVAARWQELVARQNVRLITTQFVLAEIADGLSAIKLRQRASIIVDELENDVNVEVIAASAELFKKGMDLFEARVDKNWGFTDCSSFVVMREYGITKALTTDEHFRQAGFVALLLEDSIS